MLSAIESSNIMRFYIQSQQHQSFPQGTQSNTPIDSGRSQILFNQISNSQPTIPQPSHSQQSFPSRAQSPVAGHQMPFTTYHVLQDMLQKQLLHPVHPEIIRSIKEKHFEFHVAFEESEQEQIDRIRTRVSSYLRYKQLETDSLKEIIDELLKGAECGILSVFQLRIFISKFTGASFKT